MSDADLFADTDFDRLVDEAWPAFRRERAHGWWLRHADGVTKRANSVWPAGEPEDVEAAIEAAERFYTGHGLAPAFSVSGRARPGGLDDLLALRGYDVVDPTLIMTAELSGELPLTRRVEIVDAPTRDWLTAWWAVDGRFGTRVDTAARIVTGVPAAYATTGPDGGQGVGRAVPQGEWLGVYCMAVLPAARRQGLARDVLRALLNEGRDRGARRAYLCVTERNTAARALYEEAGFTVAGRYHYRVKPIAAGGRPPVPPPRTCDSV